MSTTDSPPEPDIREASRTKDIQILDDLIEHIDDKIKTGRIRDNQKEKIKIKQWKALATVVREKRQLMKDEDLENVNERLAALEGLDEGR